MKLLLAALAAAFVLMAAATGCSSKEEQLVSKKPFPAFTAQDMEGNPVTNDVFSEYDVTLVNFWNNG